MTASDASATFNGFSFADLQSADGLAAVDDRFRETLRARDAELAQRLQAYRAGADLGPMELSSLLMELGPHLEAFVGELFGVGDSVEALAAEIAGHDPVLRFKNEFVLKRSRKVRELPAEGFDALDAWVEAQIDAWQTDREAAIARWATRLLVDPEANAEAIERATLWCVAAQRTEAGQAAVAGWTAFNLPSKVDHSMLVPLVGVGDTRVGRLEGDPLQQRRRDGFELTDARMNQRQVQGEVNYCIYCHEHNGDFCSKGFPEKKKQPELGLKVDPLGNTLTGCPLEEKISEMHVFRRDGHPVAALAVAMVDNPMVPATGHRICNDCMKACIYQKQDPVDIPQVETGTLTDVLRLPYGVEVYDLLARWNPLRREQYVQQPYNGRRVLVTGMGPAGFTMAHHLTMAGCAVVGVDGLKIEPLPRELIDQPVRDWDMLEEPLDERIVLGFGGVAEYGITVRWDKNFLKLIYLTLARRANFSVHGGVRLGGTLRLEDAWELGFDHVCVATGTGLPRVISMGNSLARGMRQASDFLMALQLTGAGKETSLANLQVRLPAVVIGGGLTGVDTATEAQAYYIKQVEKTLMRYEALTAEQGEAAVRGVLGEEDTEILDEFLEHGRAVRAERARAAAVGEQPDFAPLLRAWGGVTIAYRKGLNDSPAYTRNHEEVTKATEEGIYYAEGLDPIHCELDGYDHVRALVCRRMQLQNGRWLASREEVRLPARAVFVAAGTVPNTIYEREHPGTFALDGDHFLPHVEHRDGLQPVETAPHAKSPEFGPFTSYQQFGRVVSFIGDTHPAFHGSVVKAIASAARSYPQILDALAERPAAHQATDTDCERFLGQMRDRLQAEVVSVDTSNPGVAEVWVRAPMAVRNFRPGQFYRMQTYESLAPVVAGTRLQVPLLTVSGAGTEGDMVRLMVLQWGAGPRLISRLQAGDPVVLMGPTGKPTEIPQRETVLVVAGRWGAAAMLDIGAALRAAGNRVLYVAAFGSAADVDHQGELESAADQIVWATASEPLVEARRPGDAAVAATDMVDLVRRYGTGEIAQGGIRLADVDRILVMGGTGLLRGFQEALVDGPLEGQFRSDVRALGTAGSPMQCMLKGVCAQCLQWQKDPETGKRTRAVFSCAEQDQPLAWIDLDNLAARQQQNRLPDRLTAMWLEHVLTQAPDPEEAAEA